jgi:hypothetical protein
VANALGFAERDRPQKDKISHKRATKGRPYAIKIKFKTPNWGLSADLKISQTVE